MLGCGNGVSGLQCWGVATEKVIVLGMCKTMGCGN